MMKLFYGLQTAGLLFVSVCSAAETVNFNEKDGYCQIHAAYAYAFAWQRQNGWSVSESLAWLRRQQNSASATVLERTEVGRELSNVVLRMAYAMPVQYSEDRKNALIRDFEAESYITCMHNFGGLDRDD